MLEEILRNKNLEAILFFSPENLRYLTGFSGGEGVLLVLRDRKVLMVDSRYFEEAREDASGCEIRLWEKGTKGIAAVLHDMGLHRVGLEAAGISLATYYELAREAEGVEFVSLKAEVEALRAQKRPWAIELIRRAVELAERAFGEVLGMIRPGMKEIEVALELEFRMRRMGSEGVAFDPIVASGPRSALPHARPSQRPIGKGEAVIVDFGGRYHGYCSDETVTLFAGDPPEELKKVYQVVKEAHDRALEVIRPGVGCREVDQAARSVIEEAGYGTYFGHGTGHGVGLAVHEYPSITKDSPSELKEGMVLTVEPGIYLPGRGGVRIEDLVVVKEDGFELLTSLKKALRIL